MFTLYIMQRILKFEKDDAHITVGQEKDSKAFFPSQEARHFSAGYGKPGATNSKGIGLNPAYFPCGRQRKHNIHRVLFQFISFRTRTQQPGWRRRVYLDKMLVSPALTNDLIKKPKPFRLGTVFCDNHKAKQKWSLSKCVYRTARIRPVSHKLPSLPA